ncbi:hypothetical protein B6259_02810 [Ruminococcaceae bacterium CPB6]|nr:hypothetical protein B6259_02810 [Ruminococcaceae bacterium CPB6]
MQDKPNNSCDGQEPLPGELPPLRTSSRKKRGRKRGRGIYTAIAILLACALVLAVWVNRDNLKPANISEWVQTQMLGIGTGKGYPVHFNTENVMTRNFVSSGKDIFFTSDTAVRAYNSSAKELFNRKHSFSEPVMKVNGNRILVYNLGGTGYQLGNQLNTLLAGNADNKILGGAVCANGRFALLTQADGYCGKLTVYLPNGQVAFSYSFSEYSPTAVAMNASGTHAAVTAVSASNGVLTSVIYELDFNSNKTVKPIASYSDTTFLDICYTDSNGVLAVGDTQTAALSAGGKKLSAYSYGDGELCSWNLQRGGAVLGISKFHNAVAGMLAAVGTDGKQTAVVQVDRAPSSVSRMGQVMAALCGSKIQAYSIAGGGAAGTCSAGTNARAVALRTEKQAYILDVSEVRLEGLKA